MVVGPCLRPIEARSVVVLNDGRWWSNDGRWIYLGKDGTKRSREEFHRLIAEWLSNDRQLPVPPEELTVSELLARFWKLIVAGLVALGVGARKLFVGTAKEEPSAES